MKVKCKICKKEYEIEEWELKTWFGKACSLECASLYEIKSYRLIGISKEEREILLSKDKAYWQEEEKKCLEEANKEIERMKKEGWNR